MKNLGLHLLFHIVKNFMTSVICSIIYECIKKSVTTNPTFILPETKINRKSYFVISYVSCFISCVNESSRIAI